MTIGVDAPPLESVHLCWSSPDLSCTTRETERQCANSSQSWSRHSPAGSEPETSPTIGSSVASTSYGSSLVRSVSSDLLNTTTLETENARLAQQLAQVEYESEVVECETEACQASLPVARSTIGVHVERLRLEQSELVALRNQLQHAEARLGPDAAGTLTLDHSGHQYEFQLQFSHWLEQQVNEAAEQEASLYHRSCLASSEAEWRLAHARAEIRQGIQTEEQQLREYVRMINNSNNMDETICCTYMQHIDHYQDTLEGLQDSCQRSNNEVEACRLEARADQRSWQVERSALMRDVAHMRAHLTETSRCIRRLEEEGERARQLCAQTEREAYLVQERLQAVQPIVSNEVQQAEAAEWKLEEMRGTLRWFEVNYSDLLHEHQEEPAKELTTYVVSSQLPLACSRGAAPVRNAESLSKELVPSTDGATARISLAGAQAQHAQQELDRTLQTLLLEQVALTGQLQDLQAAHLGRNVRQCGT